MNLGKSVILLFDKDFSRDVLENVLKGQTYLSSASETVNTLPHNGDF